MTDQPSKARLLLENGEAHGVSAFILFRASHDYARDIGVPEEQIDTFAFNGQCSLSVHYLVGLGLELLLKAAYVASGGDESDKHLRNEIGHDLERALAQAGEVGFVSGSEHLAAIVGHLNEPYKQHYLRYGRPDGMFLPDNMEQVGKAFQTLADEVRGLLK